MAEWRRRAVHASGSAIPLGYLLARRFGVAFVDWRLCRYFLLAGSLAALGLEALRLTGRVDWAIFDQLTREYERENLAGYALYAFGMTVAAWAFEPRVALPAMLMLTVGDPVSGLLSSGSLAKQAWVLLVMFAVCVAIAGFFVPPVPAALGAATAAVADGLKPVVAGYVVDDNLTIPIGGGAAMALALFVL
ncbi:MAG: dolichol kinase [Halobacteriaceae archaeon]